MNDGGNAETNVVDLDLMMQHHIEEQNFVNLC